MVMSMWFSRAGGGTLARWPCLDSSLASSSNAKIGQPTGLNAVMDNRWGNRSKYDRLSLTVVSNYRDSKEARA